MAYCKKLSDIIAFEKYEVHYTKESNIVFTLAKIYVKKNMTQSKKLWMIYQFKLNQYYMILYPSVTFE